MHTPYMRSHGDTQHSLYQWSALTAGLLHTKCSSHGLTWIPFLHFYWWEFYVW